jgi:hypothetical protein
VQQRLHKRRLVSGKTLATPEKVEEGIAMFHEKGREPLSRFCYRHSRRVRRIATPGAVIEQHGGKRA